MRRESVDALAASMRADEAAEVARDVEAAEDACAAGWRAVVTCCGYREQVLCWTLVVAAVGGGLWLVSLL